MTPEALIHSLTDVAKDVEGQIITRKAEGIVLVDELSTLIDRNSFQSGMIPLLTSLWDAQEKFEYRTRGRGKETLYNCFLTIFGGSTTQWIKEAVPIVAIGGGFTSRVLFVYQERPEKLVAFPEMSEQNKTRGRLLSQELNHISRIKGPFYLTPSAKLLFKKDYETFNNESDMVLDKNLSGYAGRRHTTMMKLAMLISASERDTRRIVDSDLEIAIRMLESVEQTLPRVIQAITSEAIGDLSEEVLRFIQQRKVVKRAVVMTKFHSRLTSQMLSAILDTLLEMKVVVQEGTPDNPILVYIETRKVK